MFKWFLIFLLVASTGFARAKKTDTFRVYFRLDEAEPDKRQSAYIDSLIRNKILGPRQRLTVLGYADYLGSNGYNDTLSYKRATNVAGRMIAAGLKKENLLLCTGKGKIDRKPSKGNRGYASDRVVMIITGWIRDTTGKDTLNIDVSKIHVNARYPLNILFENARAAILPESVPELQKTLNFLKKYPNISVQIEGHVCCKIPGSLQTDGVDADNGGRLSYNRAKAVYNYLVSHGIDSVRLKYVGMGNMHPLVKEITEDDKKTNRRVEIKILSN